MIRFYVLCLLSMTFSIDSYAQEVEEIQIEAQRQLLEEQHEPLVEHKLLQETHQHMIEKELRQLGTEMQLALHDLDLEKEINCINLEIKEMLPSQEELQSCLKEAQKALQNIRHLERREMQEVRQRMEKAFKNTKSYPRDI